MRKTRKSIFLVLLSIFLVFMIVMGTGCGAEEPAEEAAEEPAEEAAEEPAEEAAEEPAEEEQEEEIHLTFWAWGSQAIAINDIAGPAFTELHPNVTVECISMGPWDLMDKFYASMVSGEGLPDGATLVRRAMGKYLMSELLYDFTDFMTVEMEGKFPESFNKDVTSPDGKILAVCWDYGPGVVFYDKGLVEEHGINLDEIVTWDDFYDVCVEFSSKNPDLYALPLIYPGGTWGVNYWKLWAHSTGQNIFDDEGQVIRDNEAMKEVNRFYYKLHTDVNTIKGPVNDPSIYDAVRDGKLLFHPGNTYKCAEIEQQMPDKENIIGTIPWPLWSEDAEPLAGVWGGEGIVVPKNGPNAEMAAEFAKFLGTNEEVLIEGLWFTVNGMPSYKPVREKILEMTDRETFASDLVQSVIVRETPIWNYTSDWAQTEKILGDNLDAMIAGAMTPDEAWETTETQLINILGR